MRDLVEYVIDGILKKEQMQQHLQHQKSRRTKLQTDAPGSHMPSYAALHSVGTQTPIQHKQRDEALWKVSLQFESIFVQQMMSEMRKTVAKSDFLPSGFAEDVHASMMDQAIAEASSRHSQFGIAESVYRQLEAAQHKQQAIPETQEIAALADKSAMQDVATEVNRYAH